MEVLILAAGFGTRLSHLIKDTPKALIKIKEDLTVLDLLYDKIKDIADDIFLVSNNCYFKKFLDWKNKNNYKISIFNNGANKPEEALGSLGDAIFGLKKAAIKNDLLLLGSDNLFSLNFSEAVKFFKEKDSNVNAIYDVKEKDKVKKYGVVEVDKNSKIIHFEEKPERPRTSLVSTACYLIVKKQINSLLRFYKEERKDKFSDFIKYLSRKRQLYAFKFDGYWFDIGDEKTLNEARCYFLR